MLDNFKVILWDFDGVIMNSNTVRNLGFEQVLNKYPPAQVAALIKYHHANGGLSRYVKFRYFFEVVREEGVTTEIIQTLSVEFSKIMRSLLTNQNLLIADSINFISNNFKNKIMHIVSGSDQEELRYLCKELNIAQYFISINGSPTPKKKLVEELMQHYKYNKAEVVFIGDSINDQEAAAENNIYFIGYNNKRLKNIEGGYINSFEVQNS